MNNDLRSYVAGFLKEKRPLLDTMSCDATKGKCDGVAADLHDYLQERGVDSSMIIGTGLVPPIPANAHHDWLGFVGGDYENQQYLIHIVVQVGNQIIDLTNAQFGTFQRGYSKKGIHRLSEFTKMWRTVKPFTPLWRKAHRVARGYLNRNRP